MRLCAKFECNWLCLSCFLLYVSLFNTLTADNSCLAVTKTFKIWKPSKQHENRLCTKFECNWLGLSCFLTLFIRLCAKFQCNWLSLAKCPLLAKSVAAA